MLPDFASMAGLRLPAVSDGALGEGVAFHHQSDRVFHRLRGFREQESWTLLHMLESGLRRGPARGVAHVGVELSLDGALVADRDAHALYLSAVETAREVSIAWSNAHEQERFAALIERLSEFGVPSGYRDPSIVADRLVRIMKPRPLLRLTETETSLLHAAVPSMHLRVELEAESLMLELRGQL